MQTNIMPVLQTTLRFLFFRVSREEMLQIDRRHLLLGLFFTWLAGIGRTWDNATVPLLQRLGLGSVLYVFGLALLVWVTIKPLSRVKLSYVHVLTFICLTSPPALIYAIPVEMFLDAATAHQVNMAFLTIVAAWRVALLIFYLSRVLELRWYQTTVSTLLMLSTIVAPLTLLRMATEILTAMSGARDGHHPNDVAFQVVMVLGMTSIFAFFPLLFTYLILVNQQAQANRAKDRRPGEIYYDSQI